MTNNNNKEEKMTNGFKKGDTVCDDQGREYELAGHIEGVGYVVLPIMDSEGSEDGWFYGEAVVLRSVYPDASHTASRLDKRVQELRERIAKSQGELSELLEKARDQRRLHAETAALYDKLSARYTALRHMDDVMEGRVTHVMFVSKYMISLLPFSKAVEYNDDYQRCGQKARRMISLQWEGGRPEWVVNAWSDGSGDNRAVRFFTNITDIKSALAEFADEDTLRGGVAPLCEEYKIELPERHRTAMAAKAREAAAEKAAAARKALAEAEATLSEVVG